MKTRTPHHRLPLAALTLRLILALPAQAALHNRDPGSALEVGKAVTGSCYEDISIWFSVI